MRRGGDATFDNRIFRWSVTRSRRTSLCEQMLVIDAARNNCHALKCQDVQCMKGRFLLSAADKTASERTYEASAAF